MEVLPPINQRIKYLVDYYSNGVVRVFAEKLGVSQQTLNRIFNIDTRTEKYPVPTTEILVAITNMFVNVNTRWLLSGKGNMLTNLGIGTSENANTPSLKGRIGANSTQNLYKSDPPTIGEFDPPTDPPTRITSRESLNLGLPKVVTISDKNDDLITLVNVKAAAGYLDGYGDPEFIETLPTLHIPNLKGGTHRAFEVSGQSMSPTIHNGSISIGRWVESFEDIKENYVYIVVTKTEGIVIKRVLNRIEERGKLILKSDNQNKRDHPNILLEPSDVLELWRLRGAFIFEFPEPNELNHKVNDLEARITLMEYNFQKMLK